MPSASRRNSAFCRNSDGGNRTFCSEDVKWLCQNSTMRSVSGWSVTSISSIHQLRSSRPCSCSGCWAACNGLPSTPCFFCASARSARAACCWRRSSAGPSFSQPGGGVMASRRTPASSRSTVAA